MRAFKGFSPDLTARLGSGRYQFAPGKKENEEASKTGRKGFHCCENPFDCLNYYDLHRDRFFQVEAGGSIDEDDQGRISCTEITPLQELTTKQLAGYGMMYMVTHPRRSGWEKQYTGIKVKTDRAEAHEKDHIAIARGERPRVRGPEGAILGLILEINEEIISAKLFTADRQQAGKWYTLNKKRELVEVKNEV